MYKVTDIDYATTISDFKASIEKATRRYDYYFAKVNEFDKASDDILHQLELGDPSEVVKWGRQLAKIRRQRRYAKDMVTKLWPIKDYYMKNGAGFFKFTELVGELNKANKSLQGRTYSPKVIKELTIAEKEKVK